MTTPAREALYLEEHQARMMSKKVAVFNPHDKPAEELPVIFGFNNGPSGPWMDGCSWQKTGRAWVAIPARTRAICRMTWVSLRTV